MAWIGKVTMTPPLDAQEPLNIALMGMVLVTVSNAVLTISYIRHRWRLVLFVSRIFGLASGFFFLAWPCDFLFIPQAASMANCFVDPRFHFESLRRNPSRSWAVNGFLGALLHHAGGVRMLSMFCQTILASTARYPGVMALPAPLLVAILCEIVAWVVDIQVILRSAPKWFWFLSVGHMLVQVAALVVALLYVPLPSEQVLPLAVTTGGNIFLFVGFVTGHGASTHEILPAAAAAARARDRAAAKEAKEKSVARRMHACTSFKDDSSAAYEIEVRKSRGDIVDPDEQSSSTSKEPSTDFSDILEELTSPSRGEMWPHTKMPFTTR